ncbi:MAG TPA: GGDEF domain-containing protein [Pyrinomonadaceae bacterium]|nr:GGDEF domain-containing protein [Pyrinomonadaceae bacterium]
MRLNSFLERRSRPFIYVACLLLVVLLGVADYLNGPDISLLVFYAVPVLVAAWYAGRRAGLLTCAASGVAYLAVAYATTGHFSHPLIAYWNAAVRLGSILILVQLVASFKRSFERERELARTDYLTGTFNGRSFGEMAEAEINRARRHAHPFTVAYMDVDDFKLVNDRHGHSAGDRVLKSVADTIRKNVRAFDTVARLGGDEFAVLMPETGEQAARAVVCRVRRQLREVARLHGWHVTFSIGVVTWDAPPASVDEMLRAADDLMYSAKRLGKNTVRHSVSNPTANAA